MPTKKLSLEQRKKTLREKDKLHKGAEEVRRTRRVQKPLSDAGASRRRAAMKRSGAKPVTRKKQ